MTATATLGLIPCRDAHEVAAARESLTGLGGRLGHALVTGLDYDGLISDDGLTVKACTLEQLADTMAAAFCVAVLIPGLDHDAWSGAVKAATDACIGAAIEASHG